MSSKKYISPKINVSLDYRRKSAARKELTSSVPCDSRKPFFSVEFYGVSIAGTEGRRHSSKGFRFMALQPHDGPLAGKEFL